MNRKIVIIGAGVSGVAAATKLIENGFTSVVLLEAENRVGGRINTIAFGDNIVELGAQWCHGEKDNVVFGLAKEKQLLESDMSRFIKISAIKSNGVKVSQCVNWPIQALSLGVMCLDRTFSNQNGSVADAFTECFNSVLNCAAFFALDSELREAYLHHFQAREMAICASDSWFELSRSRYNEFHMSSGDFFLNWKDKGYVTLFDVLTKKIENNANYIRLEDHVHLNKEVVNITYDVQQTTNTDTHPILIKCTDGSTYEADHVICSVSLGVLKKNHQTLFNPPLPQTKINSIEGIGFGVVGKIFLEFEQPFWPSDWNGFIALWRADDLKIIREQPGNEWLEHIAGVVTLTRQKNILLVWVNGPGAKVMELLPESEVKAGAISVVRKFLKDWTVPEPIAIRRSQWFSNPHFLGAYTYYSVKGESLNATMKTLSEPVNNQQNQPIVQFCGEATNEHHFKSVHGAVETGWREAERLIGLK